jgi:hypothetical protein
MLIDGNREQFAGLQNEWRRWPGHRRDGAAIGSTPDQTPHVGWHDLRLEGVVAVGGRIVVPRRWVIGPSFARVGCFPGSPTPP